MTAEELHHKIQQFITDGQLEEAQSLITDSLAEGGDKGTLYYLQGKLHARKADWSKALSAYLKAEAINPDGPAKDAREMLSGIFDFYCTDYYNP